MPRSKPLSFINDEKKMQLLKDVFFKGASTEEFMLFAHACDRSGLDPFMRQIYPVKRWDSSLKREAMTIQTGIDGYRLIAERTGCYAPGKEPSFEYNKEGKLFAATAYVKKLTKDGTWHEISAKAFYEEYCQRTKDHLPTHMWQKMPHSQLAKCAESLALRKAFPAEFSGIYTKEEMEQGEIAIVQPEASKTIADAFISGEQASELKTIFSKCDPLYVQQVMNHLKKSSSNIENIEQIPGHLFERIKQAASKKSEEYIEDSEEIYNIMDEEND
jgi:phage recombination protein Bet